MRKNNNETYILGISRPNSRSRRTLKTGLTGTAENSSSLKVQTIRRSQQHFKNISVYTDLKTLGDSGLTGELRNEIFYSTISRHGIYLIICQEYANKFIILMKIARSKYIRAYRYTFPSFYEHINLEVSEEKHIQAYGIFLKAVSS